jgi:hypothetical protein
MQWDAVSSSNADSEHGKYGSECKYKHEHDNELERVM